MLEHDVFHTGPLAVSGSTHAIVAVPTAPCAPRARPYRLADTDYVDFEFLHCLELAVADQRVEAAKPS